MNATLSWSNNSLFQLGLLTGSIRLLKSQRSKPDPILCMSMLYLTKIRPNMFAHETVTQSLCGLLKREQGAAFKNKGNPLVFVLACNMLYAGHRDNKNWPDTFIKVGLSLKTSVNSFNILSLSMSNHNKFYWSSKEYICKNFTSNLISCTSHEKIWHVLFHYTYLLKS